MKKQNQGISLISLIITIIVIIILGAVVIFSGMGTPEKAQLSAIISDMDNVQTAVDQAYYGFYTEKSVAGEVWPKSQFYEAVATGETSRENLKGVGIVPISDSSMVKMTLPKYEGRSWGVAVEDIDDHTQVGSVVLLPGYETDGKIYATLLDVQNDGRDTESMDNAMAKLNKESESSSMELVYQYGYVIAKFNNNKIKQAYVDEMKKDATLIENIGSFNTFEEFCNKIGEDSANVLRIVCYSCINTSDATSTSIWDTNSEMTMIYMQPYTTGEVRIENTLTNEMKSIEITELDEYMIDFAGGGDDKFSASCFGLQRAQANRYETVHENCNIMLKINGIEVYSGIAYVSDVFFSDYISELNEGESMDLDIVISIDEKAVLFKGAVKYKIPGK